MLGLQHLLSRLLPVGALEDVGEAVITGDAAATSCAGSRRCRIQGADEGVIPAQPAQLLSVVRLRRMWRRQ
jgi:hypothetical protein